MKMSHNTQIYSLHLAELNDNQNEYFLTEFNRHICGENVTLHPFLENCHSTFFSIS